MNKIFALLLFISFSLNSFGGNSDKEKTHSKIVAGKITDINGESIPGAKIFITETNETFFADLEGNFKFSVNPDKTYSIVVNTVGFLPLEVKSSGLNAFSEISLKSL